MKNKFLIFRNISLGVIGGFMIASCQKESVEEVSLSTEQENVITSFDTNNIKGEYIVALKKSTISLDTRIKTILSTSDIDAFKLISKFENIFQGFAVKNITEAELARLREDGNIDYIAPNRAYQGNSEQSISHTVFPNLPNTKRTGIDPHRGQLPLQNIDHTPTSATSWGITSIGGSRDGRGKVAWIIDSGILDTPELNIDRRRSRNFHPGNGGPENWQDGPTLHGTKVAGVLAAKDNGIGTTGIAAGATVVSIRVTDAFGGGSALIHLNAIEYVTKHAKRGDVWNFSNSFNGHYRSKTFNDAFKKLAGVTYGAVAAGNFDEDVFLRSPTNEYIDGIKVVGAHDNTLEPSGFSNFGVKVSLWAPGENIPCIYIADRGGYFIDDGTSFAAPHVAGMMLILGGDAPTAGQINKNGRWAGIAHW